MVFGVRLDFERGVAHHGEEFRVVDDAVLVLVGLLDERVDLFFRHWLAEEAQHGGQLVAIDVAVAVLVEVLSKSRRGIGKSILYVVK